MLFWSYDENLYGENRLQQSGSGSKKLVFIFSIGKVILNDNL